MIAEVESARASFLQAVEGMKRNFASTPDDKLNWSPTPTARTACEIVAHSAEAIHNMTEMFQGRPFTVPTTGEADVEFREIEKGFQSRSSALDALESQSATYLAFLDTVTEEKLVAPVTLPFGMGALPLSQMLQFPPMHTMVHTGQLEYLQTVVKERNGWKDLYRSCQEVL